MPILKHATTLAITRGLKAFLKLDAGLVRGEVPNSAKDTEVPDQRLRQAQKRIAEQAGLIKRTRERAERGERRNAFLKARLDVVGAGVLSSARRIPSTKPREGQLAILDDLFPHLLSAFRITEYNAYLERWPSATVHSTAQSFNLLQETRGFEEVLNEYTEHYPKLGSKVRRFDANSDLAGKLVYTLFVNNASFFLETIHAYNAPFVFTLYPGGGLHLEQRDSDEMLRRVCDSPNFQKVIATQKVVKDYLIDGGFCPPEKVEFIYGGVYPSSRLAMEKVEKVRYGADKDTFDVCFVAHKYMKQGRDKGYDVFVRVAELLSKRYDDVRFHVVGPYDGSDVEVGGVRGGVTFHGPQPTSFFPAFYSRMDAIVSPNVPFVLAPGAFDIFPLGSCIEAGTCGVGVFCTDPLDQNVAFEADREIVIVPYDADAIADSVSRYHDDPDALRELSEKGRNAFRRVFDIKAQMAPRMRVLSEAMNGARDEGP